MASEIVLLNSNINQLSVLPNSPIVMNQIISDSKILTVENLQSIGSTINIISSLIDYQTN